MASILTFPPNEHRTVDVNPVHLSLVFRTVSVPLIFRRQLGEENLEIS